MSLEVEMNIVYFPEEIPKDEQSTPLTKELKQRIFHQQAQIHMINIGPVSQDILDSRFIDADFGGVKFGWNSETKEYTWVAMANGDDDGACSNKPLPLKFRSQLMGELRKLGYQTRDSWYRPDRESPSSVGNTDLVRKEFWHLEKKF